MWVGLSTHIHICAHFRHSYCIRKSGWANRSSHWCSKIWVTGLIIDILVISANWYKIPTGSFLKGSLRLFWTLLEVYFSSWWLPIAVCNDGYRDNYLSVVPGNLSQYYKFWGSIAFKILSSHLNRKIIKFWDKHFEKI